MENASKALLMAGGVLIAIIIISLLVKTYGNIGAFQKQQISAEEAERIEEYNKAYTKYLNQYVYGTEVITVINKSINDSQKMGFNIYVYVDNVQVGSEYISTTENLKNKPFKCTSIEYDQNTGRVNKICFTAK